MLQSPMPLLPGPHLIENYAKVLTEGMARVGSTPVMMDADQQPDHGARRRHRGRSPSRSSRPSPSSTSASRPDVFLLGDLRHAHAAGRGPHHADLQGGRLASACSTPIRPDHPADRLGDGDLPVPPVLPQRPRRTRRGGPGRRRQPDALLLGHPAADEPDLDRGDVRHPVHLRLEPVSVAAADHRPRKAITPWS